MCDNGCKHENWRKHGRDRKGNPRFRCIDCGKTFIKQGVKLLGDSRLPIERAVMCLRMLLEGTSIRATSRLTGTDKTAIINLVVEIGQRCERFLRTKLVGLQVVEIQADEIWGFVGMKERTREMRQRGEEFGDAYCFTAIERSTKLLVTWHLGKRVSYDAHAFIRKLDAATVGRFQISTDGFGPYRPAIPRILSGRVDHGTLVKVYGKTNEVDQRRYSPAKVTSCEREAVWGNPDMAAVCTSHVERNNLSMRMGMRRLTRLTNAHSKKWVNHEAALALWFAYYNFCRVHMTLRTTPAVKAGLAAEPWSVLDLLREIATH